MPVILRVKGYKFWFYKADLKGELAHVHVGKGGKEAKFWLEPISLARQGRFHDHELSEIKDILTRFQGDLIKAWKNEKSNYDNS